jgi:hypothetical protein
LLRRAKRVVSATHASGARSEAPYKIRGSNFLFDFYALKRRKDDLPKKGPSRYGRPKSREETPKEGCNIPSEAQACRTAKYRLGIPEKKVQKMQSCHYGGEGQLCWAFGWLPTV